MKRKHKVSHKAVHKIEKIELKRHRKFSMFPIFLIILILAVAGGIIYLSFFYNVNCQDETCFLSNLKVCEKASYKGVEWEYKILGPTKRDGKSVCEVKVKNLGLINATADVVEKLKGKEMVCYIPMEVAGTYLPHKDIEPCTGQLKEEILSIMLKKMYEYIIQHIGEFKLESSF